MAAKQLDDLSDASPGPSGVLEVTYVASATAPEPEGYWIVAPTWARRVRVSVLPFVSTNAEGVNIDTIAKTSIMVSRTIGKTEFTTTPTTGNFAMRVRAVPVLAMLPPRDLELCGGEIIRWDVLTLPAGLALLLGYTFEFAP